MSTFKNQDKLANTLIHTCPKPLLKVGTGREGKANSDTEKQKSQLFWGKSKETSYLDLLDNL